MYNEEVTRSNRRPRRTVSARAAVALVLLVAATAGAQPRISNPRVPSPARGFYPPRTFDSSPIHPRATRTYTVIPFPADRPWLRIDTPHFILFTSGSERAARAVAEDFEKLTALLLRTSPYFRLPQSRTRLFIFHDRREVQPYLNAARDGRPVDAIGITVRHPGGSTMLVDAGARGGGVSTPRHELVHDLLRHNERPLPLWIEEGIADYYSNAGMPIPEHVSRVRGRLRMPLATMFAMTPADPRAISADFYAQSWAAVATLKRRDGRAFFEMLRDLERGVDAGAAIEQHYGKRPDELAIAMRAVGAPAPPLRLEEQSVPVEVRPLDRAELLYQLAGMLSHVSGGDDEADRHYRAALDTDARSVEAHVRYAEFLAARERNAEAQAIARHVLPLAPDDARLYAVIGVASADVAALECARASLDGRGDLDFHLFAAYLQHGDRAKADALFPRLAGTSRVNDARRILLRADIARADALARGGQVTEAARVLRELAGKMPGRTKAQLEEQAAALERK